jgi:hypothetical protein
MRLAKKQIFSWLFLIVFGFLEAAALTGVILPARAQTNNDNFFNQQTGIAEVGQVYGNQKTDIRVIATNIILIILGFLALLFLVLTIMAGFRYMTSAGNEEKARGAMKQLTNAFIGLVIVLLAWALTKFVILRLVGSINNNVSLFYPY